MPREKNGAAAKAGRPREEQPKDIRGTDAGKFGQHLAELIAAKNMSVSDFAERIGKTPAVVNFYIKGTRIPPFKSWRRIAKVLSLKDIKDLLPSFPIG